MFSLPLLPPAGQKGGRERGLFMSGWEGGKRAGGETTVVPLCKWLFLRLLLPVRILPPVPTPKKAHSQAPPPKGEEEGLVVMGL